MTRWQRAAAAISLIAWASYGTCGNLISNGDFGAGIGGWSISGTCQIFYDDVVGSPAPGSLGMNCLIPGATSETASQCSTISPAAEIDFGVRWATNTSVPGANTVQMLVKAYAAEGCAGAVLGVFSPTMSETVPGQACCGGSWRELSSKNTSLPGATRSIETTLVTGAGDVLVFDHVQLELSVIFADGFDA